MLSSHMYLLRVSQPPQTLDELGESLNLWDRLHADKPTIEAKFEPLSEQFAILEKYEVPVSPEVSLFLLFRNTLFLKHVNVKKSIIFKHMLFQRSYYLFQVIAMHNELANEWTKFQEALTEAEQMLKKHKVCARQF